MRSMPIPNASSSTGAIDKLEHADAEAVFVAFPFNLGRADFLLDLNGIPAAPNRRPARWRRQGLVPGGALGLGVSDKQRATSPWCRSMRRWRISAASPPASGTARSQPEGPTIMSWALNNHWLVNFKSAQSGRIPLRYRLTTHAPGPPMRLPPAAKFAA
jgi:alpha-mannosidase